MNITDLFQSLPLETFSKDYWGKKRYLSKNINEELQNILSWDMIRSYLSNQEFYRKTSVLLRSDSFSDAIQPQSLPEVLKGISDGYTLQIRKLQNVLPVNSKLMKLAKSLESFLIAPLDSITFFYSTPDSSPTAIHKDIPEIFSIQISGKKKWLLSDTKCLTDQMSFEHNEITDWKEYILEPGNFIYSPSYFPHQVKCVEEPSMSVALIFNNIHFGNILSYITEDSVVKEFMMRPMPIMGENNCFSAAPEKIKEFFGIISSRLSTFDANHISNEIKDQLSEALVHQGLKL